jgi:hypothetical protein
MLRLTSTAYTGGTQEESAPLPVPPPPLSQLPPAVDRADDDAWSTSVTAAFSAAAATEQPSKLVCDCLEQWKSFATVSAEDMKSTLATYYTNMRDSDLLITDLSESFSVAAHKDVLAAHSEYCRNLFSERWWGERDIPIMQIEFTNVNALQGVLRYFYSGNLETALESFSTLIDAVRIAHELQADSMINDLLPHLCASVNAESAYSLMAMAEVYRFDSLKHCCLICILKNLDDIDTNEFRSCFNGDVLEAIRSLRQSIIRYSAMNGNVYHNIKELVAMIRDAQNEAEAVAIESDNRNKLELQRCREKQGHWRKNSSEWQSLKDYETRLLKVQDNIVKQQERLQKSAFFVENQTAALNLIFERDLT